MRFLVVGQSLRSSVPIRVVKLDSIQLNCELLLPLLEQRTLRNELTIL